MKPSLLDRIPASLCHGFGCAMALVIIAGWWYGVRQPSCMALRTDHAEMDRLSALLDQRADLAARCVRQERTTAELSESLKQVSERIDAEANFAAILKSISALSAETNVRVIDLQPQPTRVDATCGYLPLRCRIQSDWPSLCHFLHGIPKLKQLVRIDTIQLGMGVDEQLSPTTIDLCVLYAPVKTTLHATKSVAQGERAGVAQRPLQRELP